MSRESEIFAGTHYFSIRTVVHHVSFYLELPHYWTHFHHKYSLLGVSELYCTRNATELSAANGLVLLECVQSLVSCLVSKFCIIKGNQTVLPNSARLRWLLAWDSIPPRHLSRNYLTKL